MSIDTSPAEAVIVAVPLATAVTSPVESTVANAGLLLDQVNAASEMALFRSSKEAASNCRFSPIDVRLAESGVITTRTAVCTTVMLAARRGVSSRSCDPGRSVLHGRDLSVVGDRGHVRFAACPGHAGAPDDPIVLVQNRGD